MTDPPRPDRSTNRGGRPSKGDRHTFLTRVPIDVAVFVIDEAERLGLTYSDYILLALVEKAGVEPPAYLKDALGPRAEQP